ncbi:MAG TPA: type II toxin-antitoxin system prevent-host-death family antitoxin [Woeseiaceae bacterium]|nr:type II toxin-antitoxin system prevent-host-death family antitoxin [Woeseiaceae bacterium]
MAKVTSAALVRGFGFYRSIAQREAVIVTNHGRDDVVMLSNEEYKRLIELDRQSMYAWELNQASIDAIAGSEPSAQADALNHLLD